MSAPAVASTSIAPSAEVVLSSCGVPLTRWRAELQRLRQRLEVQLTMLAEADALSRWWPQVASVTAAQEERNFESPEACTRTQGLLQISSADLLSYTPASIIQQLQEAVQQKQQSRSAIRQRITTEQVAMMLLEAEGVAADCVGIVAQYLNSDFEQQPYVSAYKQQ